jgi:hypothetical protein
LNDFFIVKSAGGIASQLMALVNAIYVSNLHSRPFKFVHFPYGTGVFYPFGISELLSVSEILNTNMIHKGYEESLNLPVGKIVEQGPLQKVSRERIYGSFRGGKIDTILRWWLRREWSVLADPKRLGKIPNKFLALSGGYPPVEVDSIHESLASRFRGSKLESPYINAKALVSNKEYLTIHYRIGDMRFKYKFPTDHGAGIVSPTSFKFVLDTIQQEENLEVRVVSENPALARRLLEEEGVVATYSNETSSIWRDLSIMCGSKYLISPWSTVSVFAAFVRSSLGLKTFFPESNIIGQKPKWNISKVSFYKPNYLKKEHWIYQGESQDIDTANYFGYFQKS